MCFIQISSFISPAEYKIMKFHRLICSISLWNKIYRVYIDLVCTRVRHLIDKSSQSVLSSCSDCSVNTKGATRVLHSLAILSARTRSRTAIRFHWPRSLYVNVPPFERNRRRFTLAGKNAPRKNVHV